MKEKKSKQGYKLEHSEKTVHVSGMNPHLIFREAHLYYDRETKLLMKVTKVETDKEGEVLTVTGEQASVMLTLTKSEIEHRLSDHF